MKILTGIAIGIIVSLSFPAEAQKVAPWQEKQIADPKFDRILPLPGEVFFVNGHEAFAILPEGGHPSGSVPWVWYAPTLSGLPGDEERWMFERFTKAGIAVAGIDVGESYGSPDGRNLFSAFYRELTERRGFAAKPVLLGRSRGALMTLCWAIENADKVAGFAGIYPVCNIASYPGVEKASGAYHLTTEELSKQLAEHNPIDRLEALAKAGVPLFAIHGDSDVPVPLEENSGEMKKRYEALGGHMQLIILHGQGHNMWEGFFQCRELVDFVIKNTKRNDLYDGQYCAGAGDVDFLRLIDESFAFFHPNPIVPNLTMVYKPEWDTFVEGAGWDAWWIQNSYGFSYSATPFLEEPWFSMLQRSWDLHWDNQGDGKRMSMWGGSPAGSAFSHLVAPDGSLGDMARPNEIGFKQGDGDQNVHDWFYEAAAAGVVMQAEILLVGRDLKAIHYYLPKMERACNFIEKTRDAKKNLFLVGPASNLLAPSYGGVKQPDGTFGKGYLTGLSITYLAALDRMVELYKLAGDKEKLDEYVRRQKITRESLPLLLTSDGYFAKSMEPGGVKHGVLGQERFGYLEGVANADAVGLRVVDDKTAENIYKQIAGFPAIRPFDFLLTNAPGLDDTYWNWGHTTGEGMGGFHQFGDWVNGGVWGTVEGRAILMYYRLGKFEDIRRSASRAMKWAKDFRMDAPWSQFGENTNNPWSDTGQHQVGGISVMIDNFAIPAATIRGLFDFEYRSDRLILRPRVPGSITRYTQKTPVRFGDKRLTLSCLNGGPNVKSVKVNGRVMNVKSSDEVVLMYNELPENAKIEITTEGGWPGESPTTAYPVFPALIPEKGPQAQAPAELPESLKKPFAVLTAMKRRLAGKGDADYEIAFVDVAIKSCEDYRVRVTMDPGPGYYRAISPERRKGINKFYEQAALSMYQGFVKRMERYAEKGDTRQRRIASLFSDAQK